MSINKLIKERCFKRGYFACQISTKIAGKIFIFEFLQKNPPPKRPQLKGKSGAYATPLGATY